jgi:glyoxylase-like metal-dependent hydrolase (beta-lactamase superfamily II)
MRIHALTTGTVRPKHSFLFATTGWRRQLNLFLPDAWSQPVPIHCWAIEHGDRLLVVDTGETADVHDIPFARFEVTKEDELPGALGAAGLSIADVDSVILTHMHGDHMDGTVHVRKPVQVSSPELDFTRTMQARVFQRLLRQPVPSGVDFRAVMLTGQPFGAFGSSLPLSDDGRIVAVPTPGHTPGHISVICVDDEGRHVFIAGDATDTIEQLRALRADAVAPKPAVSVATMNTILAHAREHRTSICRRTTQSRLRGLRLEPLFST